MTVAEEVFPGLGIYTALPHDFSSDQIPHRQDCNHDMAGLKRKGGSESNSQVANTAKKVKKEHGSLNASKNIEELEAQTDSDQIVESETTSQSGDDDGVSWPSDEENEEIDDWAGVSDEEEQDDGGANVMAKAGSAPHPIPKGSSTNDANQSKQYVPSNFCLC